MLMPNPQGDYHFLPGIEPYSSGVIAYRGYEIVHATLRRPVAYREGFDLIETHLQKLGRGRSALCAVELRSPAPFTRAGFVQFNVGYRTLLQEWDLLLGEHNPIARTNVAPRWLPPSEPALFGFSYTVPADVSAGKTFIVAGAGELRGGPLEEAIVVRGSETTPDAMREKAEFVMAVMSRRLAGLGAGWEDVTMIDLYTTQPIETALGPVILDAVGPAAGHGIRWYHARPPIEDLAFEMDVRGVRQELLL